MAKEMRLWEAILLGSTIIPQSIGATFRRDSPIGGGAITAACALGTAFIAGGLSDRNYSTMESIAMRWPIVMETLPRGLTVIMRIIIMNDRKRKTRQEIAEWLRPIEEEYYAKLEIANQAQVVEQEVAVC